MPPRPFASFVALVLLAAGLVIAPPIVHPALAGPDACQAGVATTLPGDPEPNDTPDEAAAVSGALCIEGELPSDDQDLFLWQADAAGQPWSVRIEGVPGTLTIVQLLPVTSDPDTIPVTTATRLIELSSPVDAVGPVVHPDLLITPGRYVLAVGRSGRPDGGEPTTDAYRVEVVPGAPLPASGDLEPNRDPATASPVRGEFSVSGDLAGDTDTFAWTIDATAAAHAWDLRVQGELGAPLDLALVADGGSTVAQAFGLGGTLELVDLALAEGTWYIRLGQAADGSRPYRIDATPSMARDVDREPNDGRATAQQLDAAAPVAHGRLARDGDRDHFALTVDEAMAARLLDIRLLARVSARRQVCLADATGSPLQCREGTGPVVLDNLSLPAGTYDIEVSGDVAPDARYLLRVDPTSEPAPDFEREPNDRAAYATPLDARQPLRGTSTPGDDDVYRVITADAPGLWDVRVSGTGLRALELVRPDDSLLARGDVAADGTSATLADLYLEPGRHWVRIGGAGGGYTVELVPLGPPDLAGEREPNDADLLAEPIRVGQERTGRIRSEGDVDTLRFSTAAEEHLVLRIVPPADGAIAVELSSDGATLLERRASAPGEPVALDVQLPAGEYQLRLAAGAPSLEPYRVVIERADPFRLAVDQEPNGSASLAQPVPDTLRIEGVGEPAGDEDWYRLEPSPDATALVLRTEGAIELLTVTDGDRSRTAQPATGDPPEVRRTDLTPGLPLYIGVRATGPYRLALATGADATVPLAPPDLPAAEPDAPAPPIAVELELAADRVAAYWPEGQVVTGTLRLGNAGATPVAVTIDTHASHHAWQLVPATEQVEVPAGSGVDVPVTVRVGPDAWASDPVRLSVQARDSRGARATASAEVTPERDAAPVGAARVWPLPDALLGGLDVASLAMGGKVVRARDTAAESALHDGVSPWGGGFVTYVDLPRELTVDLAGDEPVLVAGTILDPKAGRGKLDDRLRAFELLLSEDGSAFEVVLEGELSPLPIEQAFVLPEPIPARFARLRMRTSWGVPADRIDLGEWKVVAVPAASMSAEPLDIADPVRGGHVVHMEPAATDAATADRVLDDDTARQTVRTEGGPIRFVIGFHEARTAAISEVRWSDPTGSQAAARATGALIESSLRGPAGPWVEVGTMLRADDGTMAPLTLPEPAWARYLRITLAGGGDTAAGARELPAAIDVIEAPAGTAYRSILGEWGAGGAAGPMEWLTPPELPAVVAPDSDPGGTRALPLAGDTPVHDRVTRGEDVDRYRLTVPEGQNRLTLELGGSPFVAARLTLLDAAGYEVPLAFGPGIQPGTVAYTAQVEPGATYDVLVDQPPASVVFAFDTSPSIDPYLASVLEALRAFAADVSPGEEAVQVLPFEGRPMLPDWTDEPFLVRDAIGGYVKDSRSSAAELALLDAVELLSTQQGARAILLVSDAETTSEDRAGELWAALGAFRPLIFPVHIGGSEEPVLARHLMQDWAAVAGGAYQYARSNGEMDRAFDRLATWLRRPATYDLSWTASFVEVVPPEPGTLAVTGPAVSIATSMPIEIVLDTSGSMRRTVGRARRIDVAREALRDLVEERIPAGTPVALRVFDAGADRCGTVLEVPLTPLDPEAMGDTIRGLEVDRTTKTPIGAALDAAAQDLAGIEGPKSVVLVTDGEETCGGDPRAAIRRLVQDTGAQVNIIGFALSDKATKRRMRAWAREGRGLYYDAPDARKLSRALARAMGAPFRVHDPSGAQVAGGTVNGAPVPLPPGTYAVEVLLDPVVRFPAVVVEEGGAVNLALP